MDDGVVDTVSVSNGAKLYIMSVRTSHYAMDVQRRNRLANASEEAGKRTSERASERATSKPFSRRALRKRLRHARTRK